MSGRLSFRSWEWDEKHGAEIQPRRFDGPWNRGDSLQRFGGTGDVPNRGGLLGGQQLPQQPVELAALFRAERFLGRHRRLEAGA